MSKFNQKTYTAASTAVQAAAAPTSFIGTKSVKPIYSAPTTRTGNGAVAWERDEKSELFLLAVANMVGEDTFYEGASARDKRFRELVRKVATNGTEDAQWMARFIPWLRSEANMRTAAIVMAIEASDAQRTTFPGAPTLARTFLNGALQRPDEPGEALAYAKSRGIKVTGGIKRGIADAVTRMYNERSLLKYDGQSKDFRFGDVLELTHAKPSAAWQGDLFKYAIDRRHKRDNAIPESLGMLAARANFEMVDVRDRRIVMRSAGPEKLAAAGMTWESLAGWLQGPMDAKAWESVIPSMGYMALLRNLRNFLEAGVRADVMTGVLNKLRDPEEVAKSKQFPFRFLSAYKAAGHNLPVAAALSEALDHSLANVPALSGRTLVLVDRSPSMWFQKMSKYSDMPWADAAAVFGAALALRAEHADLVEFGHNNKPVPFKKGESVLHLVKRFGQDGGTDIPNAVKDNLRADHTRVIVVTDEQTSPGMLPSNGYSYGGMRETAVNDIVPSTTLFHMFNFGGYRAGSTPAGELNRHVYGGLSDSAFKSMALVEQGQNAEWPF